MRPSEMFAEQMVPKARERLAVISAEAPVREAADLLAKPHTDLVVVCDQGGRMIGALTKTDIVRQIRQCSGFGCTARVDAIMTCDVVSCRSSELLQDIWLVMKERGLQRIPLGDQCKRPTGILYARDALQGLLAEVEDEEAPLHDCVVNVGYQ